jgi:hypothetical protein
MRKPLKSVSSQPKLCEATQKCVKPPAKALTLIIKDFELNKVKGINLKQINLNKAKIIYS